MMTDSVPLVIDSDPPAIPSDDTSTLDRYQALIRVSEALRRHHDGDALLRSLARELHAVVRFDSLVLVLSDGESRTLDCRVLEASGDACPPSDLPFEQSLTYWVVTHQTPLVMPLVERETRFPEAVKFLQREGVRSSCALPLTTRQRPMGMLLAGSREPHAYDAEDVTFLSLVANQVALAIDDAMNYGALQESLSVERAGRQSLDASDELLRALSTVLDIREVFPRVSEIAGTVLPHDLLTFTFQDGNGDIVLQAASNPNEQLPSRLRVACEQLSGDGASIAADLETGECPIVDPPDARDRLLAAGYRSSLAIRVAAREQMLGLQFWSKRRAAFATTHIPVARRIADHVALAVCHEQLAEIQQQAAEAKLRAERLEARVKSLSDELEAKTGMNRLVGDSPAWQAVLKAATQVASTDSTVLLVGESGTGKEVIARYIHRASSRGSGPFVALNCAALPEQLLESELFGYERGAFTGAQQSKPGQLELAGGGVLFLDEVGEMSPSAQAKFLRVLQEREFQRLGGTRTLKANVRVVAATNRDLQKAMERGAFREDLFYRLRVFDIALPSLRDRAVDILPLAEEFIREIARLFGRPPAGLTKDAREALLSYPWPGNVRELRNALERAAILCEGGLITADHLSLNRERGAAARIETGGSTDVKAVERDLIVRALAESKGNKVKAAARLGLSRTQLYVRLRRYQLH
jgi:formate hydrogenlyase transcriptional activator